MTRFAPLLLLTAAAALAGPLSAQQFVPGPPTMVLGASADAATCGVDLLDTNVAGTAGDCGRPTARLRMIFPPTVMGGWYSNGPDEEVAEEFQDLLDGLDNDLDFDGISPADRRAIVEGIPSNGWDFDGVLVLPLVAFSRGGIGFSVSRLVQVEGTLPRDMVELLLEGRSLERDSYAIDAFDLSVLAVARYSLGYAREVRPGWTVGGSASLHTGTLNGYYEAGPVTIDTLTGAAHFDLTGGWAGGAALEGELFGFRSPDGAGFSVDLGTRYRWQDMTATLAVENLLSGMGWPDRTLVITTGVAAGTDGSIDTETARDTVEASATAIAPLRAGLESYHPALRIRSAIAYSLDFATVGFGYVAEPGDGLLYSTGDGWDFGLAVHPWRPVVLQASVGHWRGESTMGVGLGLALGNFLFQAGYRRSDLGVQAAISIGLVQ